MRHFKFLASYLHIVFIVVYRVDVRVGASFEVFLNLNNTVPSLFVLQIPVDFVQVFVFKHVEEVVAVVEHRDNLFIRRIVHIEPRASRWLDEEVFVFVIPVPTLDQDPAMLPPAFLFVLVLQVRYVVHPDVFLLFSFLLCSGFALGFLFLSESRPLLVCLLFHFEILHVLIPFCIRLVIRIILVCQFDP
jgi:hypothetical protein